MKIVISPAKTLDFESPLKTKEHSDSIFLKEAEQLIGKLRKLSRPKLSKLMGISPQLVELNHERYQNWNLPFNTDNARPAIQTFKGDVYIGLDAPSFKKTDFTFAQKHLRILSGLYGLLKPLDLMQAYRLEMGTKLNYSTKVKNLYQFWNDKITDALNEEFANEKNKYLINLASNEYFKSIKPKKLDAEIITPNFKDNKNGQYKVISFFAKKARGSMTAFIVKNKIKSIEDIKAFDTDGYIFNKELSNEKDWIFTRG